MKVCPECRGAKVVGNTLQSDLGKTPTLVQLLPCPTCKGVGKVSEDKGDVPITTETAA
jgi:uncharacterized protein YbaR (Trm112 family)